MKTRDPRDSRAYRAARLRVIARDGGTCRYCGQDGDTVDHIIPIVKGGDPMDMENMVCACKSCNSAKGSRSEGVFLARSFTPPAFPSNLSPKTTSSIQAGPMSGQPKPKL